jgi:hypothetical protein
MTNLTLGVAHRVATQGCQIHTAEGALPNLALQQQHGIQPGQLRAQLQHLRLLLCNHNTSFYLVYDIFIYFLCAVVMCSEFECETNVSLAMQ